MDNNLSMVDHTLLATTATLEQIQTLCMEAEHYGTASVCIPPSFVERVRRQYSGLVICTVIGFPNGYNTTECKVFEAVQAVALGADEIDMVVNLGDVKDGRYDAILYEVNRIKQAIGGKILKVIIETCELTKEEKIKLCQVVSDSQADFIKTSTGFSKAGATREDIALMRKHCAPHIKIKAAGGIRTLEDAHAFVALGADRLGSSSMVRLVREQGQMEP